MIQIRPHKIVEYQREDAPVDRVGRRVINRKIEKYLGEGFILPSNIRTDEFDWRLITRQGKIAKRMRKFFLKVEREKLFYLSREKMDNVISDIGQDARNHADSSELFYYDIVDNFNWNAGQFGDSGSCFWGGNDSARGLMEENGGMAIRFFQLDESLIISKEHEHCCKRYRLPGREHFVGIGRAWLMPYDNGYTIFNAYGDNILVKIARILSVQFGLEYTSVDVKNNGTGGGTIWINGDTGYHLYNPNSYVLSEVDFNIYEEEQYEYFCEQCEEGTNEGNFHNDICYCNQCYSEYIIDCERCMSSMERENESYYLDGEQESVCEDCWNNHVSHCEKCQEEYYDSNTQQVEEAGGEVTYCDSCANYHATHCEDCACLYATDFIIEHNEEEHTEEVQNETA